MPEPTHSNVLKFAPDGRVKPPVISLADAREILAVQQRRKDAKRHFSMHFAPKRKPA
jgi:hypothetical protein